MPRVVFVGSEGELPREALAKDWAEGTALVDVCDVVRAPVPFSCRSATCGTCLVAVVEGAEFLHEPSAKEAELLESLDAGTGQRLACQVRLGLGEGLIRIRAL